ncbi:ABC transporter permease [Spelaeicoccus albus]|uniref:ABC-2 type transport system permease protein n=1 Tax=Spelaeicoccus albus TaxID=1280376 RepID=A0A7Z0CZL4_9MICO|nr:ABC transporter permease [Spelaeicoccus albus]NYI66369.1 ABC-2 type transport system permease protein [Spelaeicoccus albus]
MSHDFNTRSTPAYVGLVLRREFSSRVRTKPFLITNIVMVVVIVGAIVTASVIMSRASDHESVGVVGAASKLSPALVTAGDAQSNPVQTTKVPSASTARDKVENGDLDAALVPKSDGAYSVIVQSKLSPELRSVVAAAVTRQATNATLSKMGVDPAEVAKSVAQAGISVDAINAPKPHAGQRLGIAWVAMLLMFFQILMFGLYVAMGVVEEKSSRVVEVLLATIKPLHLLWGKVIGIGAVGLVQLIVIGGCALVAATATGVITVSGTAVAVFGSVVGWFIIGYLFFAVLYAAAGSLVSRQEDVNTAAMPITLLFMAMYMVSIYTLNAPDSTLGSVMSWIPPFSAMLMPLRIAAGVTGPGQILITILLMLAATAVLAFVAAKIYQRSILHSGDRISWRQAVRRP